MEGKHYDRLLLSSTTLPASRHAVHNFNFKGLHPAPHLTRAVAILSYHPGLNAYLSVLVCIMALVDHMGDSALGCRVGDARRSYRARWVYEYDMVDVIDRRIDSTHWCTR